MNEEKLIQTNNFFNKEYVLINTCKVDNKEVYVFLNADDDLLFCHKENEKYIVINDKKEIRKIRIQLMYIDLPIFFYTENIINPLLFNAPLILAMVIKVAKKRLVDSVPIGEEEKEKVIKEQTEVLRKVEGKRHFC